MSGTPWHKEQGLGASPVCVPLDGKRRCAWLAITARSTENFDYCTKNKRAAKDTAEHRCPDDRNTNCQTEPVMSMTTAMVWSGGCLRGYVRSASEQQNNDKRRKQKAGCAMIRDVTDSGRDLEITKHPSHGSHLPHSAQHAGLRGVGNEPGINRNIDGQWAERMMSATRGAILEGAEGSRNYHNEESKNRQTRNQKKVSNQTACLSKRAVRDGKRKRRNPN